MSKAPAFQCYASDFLADSRVMRMTYEEVGVYWILLCHAWNDEGLPADTKELARLLKLSHRKFLNLWERIQECWFEQDGRFYQKRMEKVRAGRSRFVQGRSESGKKGGEARWPRLVEEGAAASHQATRSARLAAARERGTHTKEEWADMLDTYGRCLRCGSTDHLQKDHIVPIYQGGSDSIKNLQPLCRSCNASKGPDKQDLRAGLPETRAEWLRGEAS